MRQLRDFLIALMGETGVYTMAAPPELLDAELRQARISSRGLGLNLVLPQYPSGQSIAQFERSLQDRLDVPKLRFHLQCSRPSEERTAEEQRSLHLAVLDWLRNSRQVLPGTIACALGPQSLVWEESEVYLDLPQMAWADLSSKLEEELARFCREMGGLDLAWKLRPCRAEEEQRQTEAYVEALYSTERGELSETEEGAAAPPSWDSAAAAPEPPSEEEPRTKSSRNYRRRNLPEVIWGRITELQEPYNYRELTDSSGQVQLLGRVQSPEMALSKNGRTLICKFDFYGENGAISAIFFAKPEEQESLQKELKKGRYLRIEAEVQYEGRFSKDLQARVLGLMPAPEPPSRQDRAVEKRVELHCHSKMSAQDAVAEAKAIVRQAADFGHPAVAITDHGVVQAFPEAYQAACEARKKNPDFKLILGLEGYLVDDGEVCVYAPTPLEALRVERFCALDVETTGLDAAEDRLIEVAALRFERQGEDFVVTEEFQALINPGRSLSPEIVKLTGISDLDLLNAETAWPVLERLHAFLGTDPLVAHNALFDLGFLRAEGFRTPEPYAPRLKFNPVLIDTLPLARHVLPELPRHRLNTVAEAMGIPLDQHHRALDDARCCGEIFARLYKRLDEPDLQALNRMLGQRSVEEVKQRRSRPHHVILLARNELGLYNLYRLVSEAHTRYFSRRPRIPRSLLTYLRSGLILGSACVAGEVFQSCLEAYVRSGKDLDRSLEELRRYRNRGRYYDYFEIQPLTNNRFLVRSENTGIVNDEDLRNLNRLVLAWGRQLKKPVVATCDAHYLRPEDAIYREIMLSNMGYDDMESQAELYFRSTDEMLEEFAYLGPDQAQELVVRAPQAIAAQVEADIQPFPPGSYPPMIKEAEEQVEQLTWNSARARYQMEGEQLPELVEKRVQRELDAIISNGFAIMYYIAHKLVKRSNDDGYLVGSRGSVGSSLVATLCGITEVNPLPPHYVCPQCHYSEFDTSGSYGSGYDLPPRQCPHCGADLERDGQDIPFETFLGFNGDKQPDIDLNFSGEYQAQAHRYICEMFGETHTFRAGTIGRYAEKNADGLVRSYLEKREETSTWANIHRLAQGLIGVKRTTGQHPGGIVVIPKEREVYDFTPVQYPADKCGDNMQTTHFDFNAMHDTILKLDILGHDDPTMLKVLGDLTAVDVRKIPIPDPEVMRLFQSLEPLKYQQHSDQQDGTLGIPEMGTRMAREMIRETQPRHFFDLVQLSGLSHGTDVWKGNAQDLIRSGTCDINSVIGCRDGIMTTLIYKGLPKKAAFDIMEKVRKGKGLSAEHEALMREHQVEDWYIDSCKKIKYMFPKAHAVAYVTSALRIAWFKVHMPAAYYAAYYSVRADEFSADTMCHGLERCISEKKKAEERMRERQANPKDKSLFYIFELVEEMYCRGIRFLPISLQKSEPSRFQVLSDTEILPPFNVIPGFSTAMACDLVQARERGADFSCRDSIAREAGLGPSAMEALASEGVLEGIPESAQLDLFEWMQQSTQD